MKYIKNTLVFFALIAGLAACSSEHDNLQEYGNYPQDGVVRISSMVTSLPSSPEPRNSTRVGCAPSGVPSGRWEGRELAKALVSVMVSLCHRGDTVFRRFDAVS